jgi:hypothetical protein
MPKRVVQDCGKGQRVAIGRRAPALRHAIRYSQ